MELLEEGENIMYNHGKEFQKISGCYCITKHIYQHPTYISTQYFLLKQHYCSLPNDFPCSFKRLRKASCLENVLATLV